MDAGQPAPVAHTWLASRLQGPTALVGGGPAAPRTSELRYADGGLPAGSATVTPAATGPGLRRGSQFTSRAVRLAAAGPGLLPPALGSVAGRNRRLATPTAASPLGSAVVFPAADGPGLRRGSQSVPRAVRSAAAGPGPLPPELCYAAAGGRRFATAECRRRPLLWPSRNLAGRCRPGPTAREPVHAAGSSACRRRPGAISAGARLRRRREPALGHAVGGLPLGSAAVLPAAAGPGPRPSVPRAVRSAAAGPGPLPPGRCYAAAGDRRFTTPEVAPAAPQLATASYQAPPQVQALSAIRGVGPDRRTY